MVSKILTDRFALYTTLALLSTLILPPLSPGRAQTLPPTPPPFAPRHPIQGSEGTLTVMLELRDPPAVLAYSQAQQKTGEPAAAEAAAKVRLAQIEAAQQSLLAPLADLGARTLYRTQRVYNGIAVSVDAARLPEIRKLPGVRAIHPLAAQALDHVTSVPLVGAPELWSAAGLNATGEGIKIGIIDSGIDYLHADFGGPGTEGGYLVNDTTIVTDTYEGTLLFPTLKVVGGWDFAGDAYNADGAVVTDTFPQPDPDPMACLTGGETADHGTHVAGTAAGVGVKTDGTPYTGPYSSTLDFDQFRIGPGVAPRAQLYSLRIFGCRGTTRLTNAAIEWAVDPNGDGDFADHLDVLNLSLSSPYGSSDDPTTVAADNATLAGMIVVASAGNEGDSAYITASPAAATRVLSVAASRDRGSIRDGFRVNAPLEIAGNYPGIFAADYDWTASTLPLTETLVYPDSGLLPGTDQRTGCYTFDVTNTQRISGNIVLLDWGEPSCDSSTARVNRAFAAGARGVLFIDPDSRFDLALTGSASIPAMSIPQNVGGQFKTHWNTGLSLTFDAEYAQAVLWIDPTREDTLSTFSSRGPRSGDSALKPDLAAPGDTIFSAHTGTGNQGLSLSGASMAVPHVAGGLALLRQLHPDWTVDELKALIMNTAIHDLHTDLPAPPLHYGPARVGAGRMDLALAARTEILAADADVPGAVSLSFGAPEVVGHYTATRRIRITNKGDRALQYYARYESRTDVPGVEYNLSPHALNVPPHSTQFLTVTITADAAQMKHSSDPTRPSDDGRHWLSEESGYVILEPPHQLYLPVVLRNAIPLTGIRTAAPALESAAPGTASALRVPVYAAPRPAAAMHALQTALTFTRITETQPLSLTGLGLSSGTDWPTDVLSLVSAFELQEINPDDPLSTGVTNTVDLRYIGATNDYAATGHITETTLYFAIATYDNWSNPNAVEFHIHLDTNQDGSPDYILFNVSTGGSPPTDEFVTRLYNLETGVTTLVDYLNGVPAYIYDTAVYNTSIMVLPVPAFQLELTDAAPRFNYQVFSYNRNQLALTPQDQSAVHTFTAGRPGLDFSGGYLGIPLWDDLEGKSIPLDFSQTDYLADSSQGVLLFHYHNAGPGRTEVLTVTTPPIVRIGPLH